MQSLGYIFIIGLLASLRGGFGGRGPIQFCISSDELESNPAGHAIPISNPESSKEMLMLPPSVREDGEVSRQIKLGEKISLEELGPIIINADGTTRRITNWLTLSKSEQEQSWKLISARNLKRLKALQKKQSKEIPILETEIDATNPEIADTTSNIDESTHEIGHD